MQTMLSEFTSGSFLPLGSAAKPPIRLGASNTGLFGPAAGSVGISIGGTERWRFTASSLLMSANLNNAASLILDNASTGDLNQTRVLFRQNATDLAVLTTIGSGATATGYPTGSVVLQLLNAAGRIHLVQNSSNALVVNANSRVSVFGQSETGAQLDVAGYVRSTSANGQPTTGAGIEMVYTGGIGYLHTYNRAGAGAYEPIHIVGSKIELISGGAHRIWIEGNVPHVQGLVLLGGSAPLGTNRTNISVAPTYSAWQSYTTTLGGAIDTWTTMYWDAHSHQFRVWGTTSLVTGFTVYNGPKIVAGTWDSGALMSVGVGRLQVCSANEPFNIGFRYSSAYNPCYIGQNSSGYLQLIAATNNYAILTGHNDSYGAIQAIGGAGLSYALSAPNIANAYGYIVAQSFPTYSSMEHKSGIKPLVEGEDVPKINRRSVSAVESKAKREKRYLANKPPTTKGSRKSMLDGINQLHPILYRGKVSDTEVSDRDDIGLLAEEVGMVFPEVVVTNPDTGKIEAMMYDRLVVVCLQAIKELQREVKSLQRERK